MTEARGIDSRMPAEQWPPEAVNRIAGLHLEAYSDFNGDKSERKMAPSGEGERTAVPALSKFIH